MKIVPASLEGVFFIDREPVADARGSFVRLFDGDEFGKLELATRFDQTSISHSLRRGTLRGMHYQEDPHGETKLVTCVRGRGFDVVVDVRPESRTRWRWLGQEISASGTRAIYVPPGFAHGFLSTEDDTAVLYQIAGEYVPSAARGLRWDDPRLAIAWPAPPAIISARDRQWALLP